MECDLPTGRSPKNGSGVQRRSAQVTAGRLAGGRRVGAGWADGRMTMRGGVIPDDEISDMKGRGEALAAYCLWIVVSRCLGDEANVMSEYLLRSSNSLTVTPVDMLYFPKL